MSYILEKFVSDCWYGIAHCEHRHEIEEIMYNIRPGTFRVLDLSGADQEEQDDD